MSAPTLLGYVCRFCGNESIETPWNASDRFACKTCGALNHAPLMTREEQRAMWREFAGKAKA